MDDLLKLVEVFHLLSSAVGRQTGKVKNALQLFHIIL